MIIGTKSSFKFCLLYNINIHLNTVQEKCSDFIKVPRRSTEMLWY